MLDTDQTQLRRACDQIAASYDQQDFFCREIRNRLTERLEFITLEAETIVDLGTATGHSARLLKQRFPQASVIEIDWSMNMLAQHPDANRFAVCADAHQLPFADESVDIIYSNLMLPSCLDPERVFTEARRILKHPGLILFSTLGPDTLKELRRAWAKVDNHTHVHDFADMHNIGDALVKAGFREPVMDVETLTVNYQDVNKLVVDLRALAATNRSAGRQRGLMTPRRWQKFSDALRPDGAGRLAITLEVVTGQAWSGPATAGVQMDDGIAKFPLSRLRQYRG